MLSITTAPTTTVAMVENVQPDSTTHIAKSAQAHWKGVQMDDNTSRKKSPWANPDLIANRSQKPSRRNDPFGPLEILWIETDKIEDAPRRIRKALAAQVEAVKRSMERFGNRIPILVGGVNADGKHRVIDGHSRLAAARLLGAVSIPCIVVNDLPEVELRRLALSLNKLQETGIWDEEVLSLEITEIIEIDGDLEFPGFELPEIEAIRFRDTGGDDLDPADDLSGLRHSDATPVTRFGDLWLLGDHQLLCGSARDGTGLANILLDQPVDAVFTDPPYNLKINGHVRDASGGFAEFAEASGEMSRKEFVAFLIETLDSASCRVKPGGVLFACMDWRHVGEMAEALEALGLGLLNICVWVKTNPGMGSLYRSQHEFVFAAKKPGAGHRNNIQLGQYGRNRSNVWHYAGATGGRADSDDDFDSHPTVKPIRLVMDALLDVTAPGELVVDPFLGSGSTLLAAERTRRRCVGVEVEPAYVDLTIRRWQEMTRGNAVHAATGETFEEVRRHRTVKLLPPPSGGAL